MATDANYDAALKVMYPAGKVLNLLYKDRPTLALIPKDEKFGSKYHVPLVYGTGNGRSRVFATAQTQGAATSSKVAGFDLTTVMDFGVACISNETILATEKNEEAVLKALQLEIDNTANAMANNLSIGLYRDGYGSIGQYSGTPTTNGTCKLLNAADVTHFEVGDYLVFAQYSATGVLRNSGTAVTVTAVDYLGGTLTLSANTGDITSLADNDFIFKAGDRTNTASPTATAISGFDAWLPASAPAATAFFGVNRSVSSRLGGLRWDGSSYQVEEALMKAAVLASREGANLDYFFVDWDAWYNLEASLGTKVQYVDVEVAEASVGFRGIKIQGPKGPIKVMADTHCTANVAFGLQLDTWVLASRGKAIRVADEDGLQMVRQASAAGIEYRMESYAQLGCKGPGRNIRVKLA